MDYLINYYSKIHVEELTINISRILTNIFPILFKRYLSKNTLYFVSDQVVPNLKSDDRTQMFDFNSSIKWNQERVRSSIFLNFA